MQPLPKDVILVSGPLRQHGGREIQQAQEALGYILRHLNPEDRFNVIAFSTGLESYASRLRPASEAAEAAGWVERLGAPGQHRHQPRLARSRRSWPTENAPPT